MYYYLLDNPVFSYVFDVPTSTNADLSISLKYIMFREWVLSWSLNANL